MSGVADGGGRPLRLPLLVAILALPLVFAWLLLRPRYSNELRIGAFAYLLLGVAAPLVAGL